jgi:competence protein ComFC
MKKFLLSIKQLIFASRCLGCRAEKSDSFKGELCSKCYAKLKYSSSLKEKNGLYYIWRYEGVIKKIIESYKFKNKKSVAYDLAELIREKIIYIIEKNEIDVIIPVPISKRRKSERGYNHVAEILIAAKLNFLEIKRIKKTKHMFEILQEEDRISNIKNSFQIDKSFDLNGKNILIFDDIITTGATFKEIKKVIEKNFNTKKIIFFSITAAKYSLHKGVDLNGIE